MKNLSRHTFYSPNKVILGMDTTSIVPEEILKLGGGRVLLVEDLSKLVDGGIKQARLFEPNPKDLTEKDVKLIYEGAF
jgi:alcohol dehydrogenase class IV